MRQNKKATLLECFLTTLKVGVYKTITYFCSAITALRFLALASSSLP